jgi:hypothetical protein
MNATRIPSLLAIAAMALLAGCAKSDARYPVYGQVLSGDKPVAEAMIVFHPQFETPPGQPKPLGITDAEGKFQLTTLQANDGASPGDYRITVELRQERPSGEEITRDGPNLLPGKYARSETTPLQFTVTSGRNEMPALVVDKK